MTSRGRIDEAYEQYLIAHVRASVLRPKEPALLARLLDLRPGRLERVAARALGVADGLAEKLRSRNEFRDELERLLDR